MGRTSKILGFSVPAADEERWVDNLIAEAKAEQAQTPMSSEQLLAEGARLARYGDQQSKKAGIRPRDVSRVIHEYRKERCKA